MKNDQNTQVNPIKQGEPHKKCTFNLFSMIEFTKCYVTVIKE